MLPLHLSVDCQGTVFYARAITLNQNAITFSTTKDFAAYVNATPEITLTLFDENHLFAFSAKANRTLISDEEEADIIVFNCRFLSLSLFQNKLLLSLLNKLGVTGTINEID